jgi:hypothetical protein
MKTPEYTEGPEALENFERGGTALFKVPKPVTKKGSRRINLMLLRGNRNLPTRVRRGLAFTSSLSVRGVFIFSC